MERTANELRAVPVVDWFDPAEMMHDPFPAYERMRALGPIVSVPLIGRYLLTTFESVTGAEQHPELFSARAARPTMVRAIGGRPMLRKDDPEHAAERNSINPTLRPRAVTDKWSPRFRDNVRHRLDVLEEIGPQRADLNRDFALPLASQNLIDLLGLERSTGVDDVARWSIDFIAGIGNVLDDPDIWARCERSRDEANAALDDLIPRLASRPDASITSHLIQAGLPQESVRANVLLAISGGMNEPAHMMTNMMWALDGHRDQLDAVRGGEVSWGDAFEETVRWQAPIGMLPRETHHDVEWLDHHLPAQTNVGLLLAAANRDPAKFVDPDRFDVRRTARGHLGFGSGTHMCAGRWAAKAAVGEIALPMLFERFPGLRVDTSRATTWHGWVFRGLTALPVIW